MIEACHAREYTNAVSCGHTVCLEDSERKCIVVVCTSWYSIFGQADVRKIIERRPLGWRERGERGQNDCPGGDVGNWRKMSLVSINAVCVTFVWYLDQGCFLQYQLALLDRSARVRQKRTVRGS